MTLQIGGPPPNSTVQSTPQVAPPAYADQYLGAQGAYRPQPAASQPQGTFTAEGVHPIQQYVFTKLAPHFEATGAI